MNPAPAPCLQDRFGRRIDYLRLSVTDRCDLRCSYCRPKNFDGYAEPADWLSFAEIERVVAAFARLGVARVRLTGGEPLLRRNLVDLVGNLAALPGVQDLSLSTNATQLAKHAVALKAAGLRRINVSLDSLDRDCVAQVCGRDTLGAILEGILAAKAAGIAPIKLNMVLMKGINDHEVEHMAEFCIAHGFILRMIEAMPIGEAGRNTHFLSLEAVRPRLVERFGLQPCSLELGGGPARYWATADGQAQIGFITPITQHFCATCNRVRLAVDGTLYLCLGQEERFELRPLLRDGASDAELEAAIRSAIELKPNKHEFIEAPGQIMRFMSQTGG
ncbi:GTP 3',8-cyclase MoaA [Uliginosibacterium gangwonense]|uniref:GTP 3',8-cyclase MoaA n=1 Tax=Uliginosibacterium gangwonense TaxID=392736 RepID=UPI00035E3B59|nr:GTP 3',8-cyclase MoaA [Uliginosibacterium gangwonense]